MDDLFPDSIIGTKIMGVVKEGSSNIILLDNGETIQVSQDGLSNTDGYWVVMGTWKPQVEKVANV